MIGTRAAKPIAPVPASPLVPMLPSPMLPGQSPQAPIASDAPMMGNWGDNPAVPDAPSIAPTNMAPPVIPNAHVSGNGIFDRIGDFVKSDEGRGALLRSGAATLNGGLGAGIAAGANFVDQRHQDAAKQQQLTMENRLKQMGLGIQQQSVDQTGQYQDGQLELNGVGKANDIARTEETARHNKRAESLTGRGQDVQMYGHNVTRENAVDSNNTSMRNTDVNSATSRYGSDNSLKGSMYGTDGRSFDTGQTIAAGIGSKASKSPSASALKVEVLPANAQPGDLTTGKYYRTAKGVAQWDGLKFISVN
ncbi:hypothetical protein D3Y57_07085 [Sphingomonas paeninsulae]|uniref:Uncharacterized protein n=1 Tax=Sphingomonas paeninsulae TaxID=2319844 RepID=A0A494TET6_SPHPE|nr:hypothetical protein [Sphingomonas paeninsulae]AYJ85782.1 hypothetical protein D3Y57_07085 [Sphingomonas paeninsulae]